MYYVKVQGEKISDLVKGLQRHLKELTGLGEFPIESTASVEVLRKGSVDSNFLNQGSALVLADELDDDGFEDVPSQYVNSAPDEAPSLKAAPTLIVDNERDVEGLPWDSRIHASSKAKVGKGTWRIQRGVDENLVHQVKSELRLRYQAPVAPVLQEAPPVVHTPPSIQAAPPVQTPPPVAPPLPSMNSNGHTLESFKAQFPLVVANLITQGKINQDYVNQLNAHFGVTQIHLMTDEQKALVFNDWVGYGFVVKVG